MRKLKCGRPRISLKIYAQKEKNNVNYDEILRFIVFHRVFVSG